jgi:hypothetical protein
MFGHRGSPGHRVPPRKSLANVAFRDATISESLTIKPTSRFLVSEPLEKFSDPTKARRLSARITFAWM